MCYALGSITQATKTCPMCKVFRPSHARCPHIKGICRNRALHPRLDVVFLKNAEVQSFNGCGYCKWARTNPPPKHSGYQNPGWPGCCRPPTASEHRWIKAADWISVSVVHQVPIPSDIKALLYSLPGPAPGTRNTSGQSLMPSLDRRNSCSSSPSHKSNLVLARTPSVTVSMKVRAGSSPQPPSVPLVGNPSRGSGGNPSSVPTSSPMEHAQPARRQINTEITEKRQEQIHSSHSSPNRKNVDLETSVTRRSSSARPSVTNITNLISATNLSTDTPSLDPQTRRRGSVSTPPAVPPKSTPVVVRATDRSSSPVVSRTQPKRPSLEISSASSSSGSGESLSSSTDGTVTSDGGFTDYLSDESEVELQRQAEARAVLVAQVRAEELEFKAARQQLANIDLRPPKSWNTPSTPGSSGPSAHVRAYSSTMTYPSASFATAGVAHSGASSRV